MVAVEGSYCARATQRCLGKRRPWQCAEFAPTTCAGPETPMRFCVDRYEYPNRPGALPARMASWHDARKACAALGKRLCTGTEWTLACEGPRRLPFPYGLRRDAQRCNIDHPNVTPHEARLYNPATRPAELARLDRREPSGARPGCASEYGVFDLTGNVDEWVVNESGVPYHGGLKGGSWGEYRNACRPVTLGHGETFRYYQTGFRCCRDAPADGRQ
jgi:formylglycine-generating enzyme required for sulfatase activity